MRKLGYKLGKIFVANLDVQGGHKRVVGNEKSKLSHELGNLFWFLEARFRWKLGNLDKCSEIFCCIHTALGVVDAIVVKETQTIYLHSLHSPQQNLKIHFR